MPKAAITVTDGDIAVAKRVLERLDPTSRRFVRFKELWDKNEVPGTRTLPLRQMRALFDAARGRGAGPYARFYTAGLDENWFRFQASDRISEVNVLRPGAPNPSIIHSGSGQQTNIFGLASAAAAKDCDVDHDPACPCDNGCSDPAATREAQASDFTEEACKVLNQHGFYPVVINNWKDKQVIHDCLTHAPPEVRSAHGLPADAEARARSPSDTRRRTSARDPAASSPPSAPA